MWMLQLEFDLAAADPGRDVGLDPANDSLTLTCSAVGLFGVIIIGFVQFVLTDVRLSQTASVVD